jgi:hypothetical protein
VRARFIMKAPGEKTWARIASGVQDLSSQTFDQCLG